MVGTSYLQHVAQPFIYYLVLTFLIGLFIGGVVNNIFAGITVELGRQFKSTNTYLIHKITRRQYQQLQPPSRDSGPSWLHSTNW
jgi:hypothetical protein